MSEQVRQANMDAEALRDRIRGCLIGGAAGDALGYPVEFLPEKPEATGGRGIGRRRW